MSHSMAASSSKISETPTRGNLRRRDEVQPVLQANKRLKPLPSEIPKLADQPVTPHDIFLSHSGAQKGFVKDLYDELSHRGFNTFFDLAHHSLPLAENFPMHIFSAANNCKLAVVVLSEEFVSTKWPMIELSAFVEAGVQILPLFFKLLPEHLKDGSNLKRWGEAWEGFSAQDPVRIKITEWENAIEALRSKNGLAFKGQALEGETTYLHRVVSGICEKVPMAIKFDGSHIHGMNQLRQVILDEFKNMESPGKVNVLGLYGLPGSGKSTLCQCLHDHFYPIYGGRSLYLELPTKPSTQNLVQIFKKLLHLTDFNDRFNTSNISTLGQREVLFDGLFPFLLNCFEPDDNECVNFRNRELQEKVGGVAKKDLVQEFQAHPQCKLLIFRLLDKFGFWNFYEFDSDLPLEGIHDMFDAIVEYIFDKEEGSESQEEEGYDDSEDESEEEGYDNESGAE